MGQSFSGSSQRRAYMAEETAKRAELDKQQQAAEQQQTSVMQDSLNRDTRRILRVFGTRALMSGGGIGVPAVAR